VFLLCFYFNTCYVIGIKLVMYRVRFVLLRGIEYKVMVWSFTNKKKLWCVVTDLAWRTWE